MTTLQLVAILLLLSVLGFTIKHTQLALLKQTNQFQHLFFGATASIFILWMFRAGIENSPTVHFLWIPALVLTLGFRWGLLSAVVALFGVTLAGKESWQMFGINGLVGILVPMAFCYLILMLVFHKLPRNLFVYIFLCAFLPGAMSIALKMFLLSGYYAIDNMYTWDNIRDNYLILTPLLLFPEAMLNGMTITLLTIYKPEWVYTFQDKFYFNDKD